MAVFLLAVGLACGVGNDPEAELAACARDFAAGVEESQPGIPERAAEETAQRVCREAEAQGLLESDDEEAFRTLVRDDPDVLHPLCTAQIQRDFGFTASKIEAWGLRKDVDRFGRSYCDRAVEAGFISLGRPPSPEEIARLFASNPDLGVQGCFLGAMAIVEDDTLLATGAGSSRSTTKRFARRMCRAAVSEGLVDWTGAGLTPKQSRRLAALCREVSKEVAKPEAGLCGAY